MASFYDPLKSNPTGSGTHGFSVKLLQVYGLFVLFSLLFNSATCASTLLANSGSEKYSIKKLYGLNFDILKC